MEKTIAAIATPAATGGISVIRISGEDAFAVADRVFEPSGGGPLAGRRGYTACFGAVRREGEKLDDSVALVFRGPKSYTGEDVVELSCHGGVLITREVLRVVLEAGASLAAPGEFTKRAYLNGKLSLTQAEAVADLIGARSRQALTAARAQLDGALSRRIGRVREELLKLAGHLSAWADYPEEDIPQVERGSLSDSLKGAGQELGRLLATFDAGRLLREGIDTVIAGKPNVGKSTLMNLLAGCRRSIVTDVAGTTRDVVEETVTLGELLLRLSDTAGIRQTADPVEKIGVQLAEERLDSAALVLAVFDCSAALDEEDRRLMERLAGRPVVAVVNKSDLVNRIEVGELEKHFGAVVAISALEEECLGRLEQAIAGKVRLLGSDAGEGILATERQHDCAVRAAAAVGEALAALESGMTLDAVEISVEEAIGALLELSGGTVTEEVVDKVFSQFCVGK